MEGHGRSQDDRAAAREERERARVAREQGLPLEGQEPEHPDLGSMSRYGGNLGNMDVYTKRRIIAAAIGIGVILILFLLVGGC